MQITLDLPDDAFAKADALAKAEARSLASVIADFIRGGRRALSPQGQEPKMVQQSSKLPVVQCSRQFTLEEIDRMLEEDGLP